MSLGNFDRCGLIPKILRDGSPINPNVIEILIRRFDQENPTEHSEIMRVIHEELESYIAAKSTNKEVIIPRSMIDGTPMPVDMFERIKARFRQVENPSEDYCMKIIHEESGPYNRAVMDSLDAKYSPMGL